ncbi:hypothetical protein AXF42_Ash013140 [Apostasia shenzhenica]|uniref:Uncharacterized protein n=1 Tax=Apostasia shenzhenica TaxID=1088818 RepID=A0A2I0BD65_9ASPA|nr:hypothetical protein AXF42_Ash013140 [Apostasia shenzhenica]
MLTDEARKGKRRKNIETVGNLNQRMELSEKQNVINNDVDQLVKTKRKWAEKGDIYNFQEEKDNSFVVVQNSERRNLKSEKHQNEKKFDRANLGKYYSSSS